MIYFSQAYITVVECEKEKIKNEIQKVDIFQYFVKRVTNFIFSDKSYNELLYKIRYRLMNFFTTILEEKNCNEEVHKFIIKYLNIYRVFNSINSILKGYYLSKSSDNNIEKIIKTIKGDLNYLPKTINVAKRQSNPQFKTQTNYNDVFTINSTYWQRGYTRVNKLDLSNSFMTIKKDNIMFLAEGMSYIA